MKWKNGRLERVVVVVVVAVGGGGGTVGPQLWKCVPGIHRTDSSRQTLGSAIARVVAVCSLRDAGKLALARPNKKKHHNHPTSLPPPLLPGTRQNRIPTARERFNQATVSNSVKLRKQRFKGMSGCDPQSGRIDWTIGGDNSAARSQQSTAYFRFSHFCFVCSRLVNKN